MSEALGGELDKLRRQGRKPVVLCAPKVRSAVRRSIRSTFPDAGVLAYNEVDSVDVKSVAAVRIEP